MDALVGTVLTFVGLLDLVPLPWWQSLAVLGFCNGRVPCRERRRHTNARCRSLILPPFDITECWQEALTDSNGWQTKPVRGDNRGPSLWPSL